MGRHVVDVAIMLDAMRGGSAASADVKLVSPGEP